MAEIPQSQTEGKAPQAATQILTKLDADLAIDAGDTAAAILAVDAVIGDLGNVTDAVQSTDATNIVKLTQVAFDALSPPDATTLYLIVG